MYVCFHEIFSLVTYVFAYEFMTEVPSLTTKWLQVSEANEVPISSYIYIYICHVDDIQTVLKPLKKTRK